jgi:hypothetical protein
MANATFGDVNLGLGAASAADVEPAAAPASAPQPVPTYAEAFPVLGGGKRASAPAKVKRSAPLISSSRGDVVRRSTTRGKVGGRAK